MTYCVRCFVLLTRGWRHTMWMNGPKTQSSKPWSKASTGIISASSTPLSSTTALNLQSTHSILRLLCSQMESWYKTPFRVTVMERDMVHIWVGHVMVPEWVMCGINAWVPDSQFLQIGAWLYTCTIFTFETYPILEREPQSTQHLMKSRCPYLFSFKFVSVSLCQVFIIMSRPPLRTLVQILLL